MADDKDGRERRKERRIEKRKDEKKNSHNKIVMSADQRKAAAAMKAGLKRLNNTLNGK